MTRFNLIKTAKHRLFKIHHIIIFWNILQVIRFQSFKEVFIQLFKIFYQYLFYNNTIYLKFLNNKLSLSLLKNAFVENKFFLRYRMVLL